MCVLVVLFSVVSYGQYINKNNDTNAALKKQDDRAKEKALDEARKPNSSSSQTTTITPTSTTNTWTDNSHIKRQNEAGARYDARVNAAKSSYESKLARLETLIKERNITKSRENYYAVFNCALDAGFDNYMASRVLGYDADEYQAMLVRQGISRPESAPQYSTTSSNVISDSASNNKIINDNSTNNNSSIDPNVNGNFTGYGTKNYSHGTYVGNLVLGVQEGNGKMTYNNGESYEGQIKQNELHGFGTFRWNNGDLYSGNYQNNKRQGKGVLRYGTGDLYEGDFLNDMKTGYGVYKWKEGTYYKGNFVDGQLQGDGKFYNKKGYCMSGTFENGKAINVRYYDNLGSITTAEEFNAK